MQTFTSNMQKALQIAVHAHWDQKRKGIRDPYINHIVAVTFIVHAHTAEEDIICAALLHDVLEDVPAEVYSKTDMKRDFGTRVVTLVESVSEPKNASMTKEEERANWQERKQEYLKAVEKSTDEGTVLICAADKIHNLQSMVHGYRTLGNRLWENFNNPPDKKLWFYNQVLLVLKKKSNHPILKELEETLNQTTTALHLDIA